MLALKKLANIAIGLSVMLMSCQPVNNLQTNNYAGENPGNISGGPSDPDNTSPRYLNDIPVRVMRTFIKEFSENANASWQKTNKGLWVATFTGDSLEQRIDFNRTGSWNHKWTIYTKFPPEVCARVTKNFPGYSISAVDGLVLPQDMANTIYSVTIKKENNCKVIKLYKTQIEVISDFMEDTDEGK